MLSGDGDRSQAIGMHRPDLVSLPGHGRRAAFVFPLGPVLGDALALLLKHDRPFPDRHTGSEPENLSPGPGARRCFG